MPAQRVESSTSQFNGTNGLECDPRANTFGVCVCSLVGGWGGGEGEGCRILTSYHCLRGGTRNPEAARCNTHIHSASLPSLCCWRLCSCCLLSPLLPPAAADADDKRRRHAQQTHFKHHLELTSSSASPSPSPLSSLSSLAFLLSKSSSHNC